MPGFVVSSAARIGGVAITSLFRFIPAARRFRAVRVLARLVGPVALVTPQYRHRSSLGRETAHESIVYLLLYALGLAGITVPVPLEMPDLDVLDTALASGGVLLVAPHTGLIGQAVIWFGAHGYRPIIVTANTRRPRPGTGKILLGPNFMLRVRSALRQGRLVLAMIDHQTSAGRRVRRVENERGSLNVSDGLLRLALRCGATPVFGAARLNPRGVTISLARPPATTTADDVVEAFAGFVLTGSDASARVLRSSRPDP